MNGPCHCLLPEFRISKINYVISSFFFYTFNIQFMYENVTFFLFTIKQIISIFCNLSFARQYSNWRLKKKTPYLPDSARSGQSNAMRCELDNQYMNSVLALKIFESNNKMHLRCFGVNNHPCYQIRFIFVCSRSAPVLAKDINLQI